jgi:hypothetical protein
VTWCSRPVASRSRGPASTPPLTQSSPKAAAELNAWVDYLAHPETNGGPRIYRPVPGRELTPDMGTRHDIPSPRAVDTEADPNYHVVSALEGYATDPSELFKAAEAVSGVSEAAINEAYAALTQGCFTFPPSATDSPSAPPSGEGPAIPVRDGELYGELSQIRVDWMAMRHSMNSPEFIYAQVFEDDFIRFQVYVENGYLRVAEHLVKYRAIFQQAGADMAKVMDGLTQRFATYGQGKGLEIDLRSFLLTGLVEVACAVITGGLSTVFKVKTIAEVATQMVGDAGKTAKDNGQETNNPIDDHPLIIDTVKQYLDVMAKIERDTASAISDLSLHLHTKVVELEQRRRFQNDLTSVNSDMAPQFLDYTKRGWRV